MIYGISLTIIIVASVLVIIAVLLQNSKGGGLAANFASAQVMGVRKTADFLEKATWVLASVIVGFSIIATLALKSGGGDTKKSLIKDKMEAASGGQLPMQPAQDQPAQEQPAAQPAE